jgi:DNA-binding transcriptional regulator YiaG
MERGIQLTTGDKIKAARRALKVTQIGLGRLLDIDNGTISRWEKNKMVPSDKHIKKLNLILLQYNVAGLDGKK